MRPAHLPLLFLAFTPSRLPAQGPTHLNVAPSQMVEVTFWRDATASNVYVMGAVVRADGLFLGYAIPAGKLLVLRDAQATFFVGPRAAAQTLVFDFRRGFGTGGTTWSYGGFKRHLLRIGVSASTTDEALSFDLPAGMAFTDQYRPRLTISGASGLVTNVSVSGWGYLVDLPPAVGSALLQAEPGAPGSVVAE